MLTVVNKKGGNDDFKVTRGIFKNNVFIETKE